MNRHKYISTWGWISTKKAHLSWARLINWVGDTITYTYMGIFWQSFGGIKIDCTVKELCEHWGKQTTPWFCYPVGYFLSHLIRADLKMSCVIIMPSPMHKYMCASFYPYHFEFWKLCAMLIVYSVISLCGVLMKWWLYIFLRQENQRSARYWHTVSVWRGLSAAQL